VRRVSRFARAVGALPASLDDSTGTVAHDEKAQNKVSPDCYRHEARQGPERTVKFTVQTIVVKQLKQTTAK